MRYNMLAVPVLALGLLAGPSAAYWRLSCGIAQTARIDPIITPGKLSSHAHKIAGASNINVNSDYNSLQQAKCSSCEIQDDKSAYWTPPLYYHHANGSFEEVPNSGMTVYYLGRGDNASNLQPFPPGFRMVSGNTAARSYNTLKLIPGSNRPVADRVSFACLDVAPSQEQPGMVSTSCKYGLRAQIHFQSCWDGQNLYKADNSHVEYMSGLDNGKCPSTHPIPFIHIFFEVLYGVNNIKLDGGKFVFSNGDTTGFGFHGDFLNGWKASTLTDGIKQCANTNQGGVEDCAPFTPSLDPNFSRDCPEQPSVANEPVHGMIDKLPGCITITSGPADATDADMNCPAGQGTAQLQIGNTTAESPTTSSITDSAKASTASAPNDDDTKLRARNNVNKRFAPFDDKFRHRYANEKRSIENLVQEV